jgi:hypothetical protein
MCTQDWLRNKFKGYQIMYFTFSFIFSAAHACLFVADAHKGEELLGMPSRHPGGHGGTSCHLSTYIFHYFQADILLISW